MQVKIYIHLKVVIYNINSLFHIRQHNVCARQKYKKKDAKTVTHWLLAQATNVIRET